MALGGGGARGVAHIAYLKAMEELGIKPCIVSGTSSGAIVGALYAGGMSPDDMLAMLNNMSGGKKNSGLIKAVAKIKKDLVSSAARKTLDGLLPVRRFDELRIPLKVVATNINTLQERVFTKGSILDALMCSTALPGSLLPQMYGDQYYIDGGATNIVPFDIIRDDCDILVAIDVSQVRPNTRKPTTQTAQIAEWAAAQEALISLKLKGSKVDVLERPTFEGVSTMEFDKFNQVYKRAEELVPDFKRKLEKFI